MTVLRFMQWLESSPAASAMIYVSAPILPMSLQVPVNVMIA
jgi:hypothetical protein